MSCAGCDDCSLVQMAGYASPFEIHITVSANTDRDEFLEACKVIGVKALIIENFKGDASWFDLMTRDVVKGAADDALEQMNRVSQGLRDLGLRPVRNKIETVPWIYDTVSGFSEQQDIPYFETHIEVVGAELKEIIAAASQLGGYVSKNATKSDVVMVTFRLHHTEPDEFKAYSERMRSHLTLQGFTLNREIIELTFFDDNLRHDENWLK